jgi:phosphatidylserine decarboxylase
MKIHKEGYWIISKWFAIIFTLNILLFLGSDHQTLFHYIFYIITFLVFLWIVSFFRYPLRKVEFNESNVLSSADGEVVVIEEVFENEFLKDKRIQVSIFMSPLNVHANSYPVSGEVTYTKYHPGKHLFAYNPKSSLENEMTTTVIKNSDNKSILIRQIAGIMARRIVCYARQNDKVKQTDELGFIKFGSRVDLLLPPDAEIKVRLKQKVKGKQTIIAVLK